MKISKQVWTMIAVGVCTLVICVGSVMTGWVFRHTEGSLKASAIDLRYEYSHGFDDGTYGNHFNMNYAGGSITDTDHVPHSPSRCVQHSFPVGHKGGTGRGTLEAGLWPRPGPDEELYTEWSFKYSSNWQWHTISNKQFYWMINNGSTANWCIIVTWSGNMRMTYQNNTFGTTNFNPNQEQNLQVQRGVWYTVRTYTKLNTNGQANGIFKLWMRESNNPNFTLISNHSNVPYLQGSEMNGGIGWVQSTSVWGGLGEEKTVADFYYVDAIKISSANFFGDMSGGGDPGDPGDPDPDPVDPPDLPGDPDIKELQDRIDELIAKIQDLEDDIANLGTNITWLQDKMQDLEEFLDELREKLGILDTIPDYQDTLDEIMRLLNELKTASDQNEILQAIAQLAEEIAQLKAETITKDLYQQGIDELLNQINDLSEEIKDLKDYIAELVQEIANGTRPPDDAHYLERLEELNKLETLQTELQDLRADMALLMEWLFGQANTTDTTPPPSDDNPNRGLDPQWIGLIVACVALCIGITVVFALYANARRKNAG